MVKFTYQETVALGLLESRVQDSIRSIVLNSITVLH
jgi:hypothetical protein